MPRPIVPTMRCRGSRPKATGAFRPESLAHQPIFAQQIVRKSQHEQHDGLGYRAYDPGGRDEHSNSLFGAGLQIDVVIANAAAADGT